MTVIIANLFLILAAGWLFRRWGLVGEGSEKVFNQYLYYLALPALTIVKIADTPLTGLGWQFVAANSLPLLAMMALAWLLWKAGAADWRLARVLVIAAALGNTVYMGFPVAAMRLGEQSVGYAAIAASLQNVVVFTAGFAVMTLIRDESVSAAGFLRPLLRSVVLWSSLAGLAVSWSGLGLPDLLHRVMGDIGKTTMPLSLFTIGVSLYGKKVSHNLPKIAVISAFKLLLLPALCVLFCRLTGFAGFPAQVSFVEIVMPVAVLNFVVARDFGFDQDLVGQTILFSTLAFFPLLYLYDWAIKVFLG